MTTPTLKPCPFCGDAEGVNRHTSNGFFDAGCIECGASTSDYDTAEKATAHWNTRPLEAELLGVLESIALATDPNDPENLRASGEYGCLDSVYIAACEMVQKAKGQAGE